MCSRRRLASPGAPPVPHLLDKLQCIGKAYQMARKNSTRRQELLQAIFAELEAHGIAERSLRDIAAAVGTSHRMLIHHFGSREALLTEIVDLAERRELEVLSNVDLTNARSAGEAMVMMWDRLKSPDRRPSERLFFECYARALQGEAPFSRLLPDAVEKWISVIALVEEARGYSPELARIRARLGFATFRGLLMDLLATGDEAGNDAAYRYFVDLASSEAASAQMPNGPAK